MSRYAKFVMKGAISCLALATLFAFAWAQQPLLDRGKPGPLASPAVSPSPVLQTLYDTLSALPQFSNFVQAINAAGLADTLRGSGPFTVFAPTNDAYGVVNGIDDDALPELNNNPGQYSQIIQYGMVPGIYGNDRLMSTTSLQSKQGQSLFFVTSGGKINVVNNASVPNAIVSDAEIPASNGVIHPVSQILFPPGFSL